MIERPTICVRREMKWIKCERIEAGVVDELTGWGVAAAAGQQNALISVRRFSGFN